ncbi:MAG: hypothetical protein ACP5OG_01560 [Candidatus Nanoarchaeia archaeon]
MQKKKQIIFIEPSPTVYAYRIAKGLKTTGKYETMLICFSKLNQEQYKSAYDKIIVFELSHKIKNLFSMYRKIKSKEGKAFFSELGRLDPYLFQITGPDLFSYIAIKAIKKETPKIYYSNDLWGCDRRNFFFTRDFWVKGEVQKYIEKKCLMLANGALNKNSLKEYELLKYKLNIPKMALPPVCLDEWIISPKSKKNKETHLVFAASPAHKVFKYDVEFMAILKIITSQNIHFHTYGPAIDKELDRIFIEESKKNKYYHYHEKVSADRLNQEMSEYNYGVFFYFMDPKKTDSFPEVEKSLVAAKMLNYIESGLPIMLNSKYEAMKEIIDKYGIGLAIDFNDLKNLGEILKKQDYKKMQRNIKKFQEDFKLSKKIKEIEKFYEYVASLKNSKN